MQGRIYLNPTDSLTMQELREALKRAVRGGLQLAFFNSCDGLGIASELENLNIPQVIVMREPVPDKVANQFLKYFFQEFTGGKSFYKSVNIARRKLQGLETKYPCASWLPVIVQNLLEIPPTWQNLGAIANCPYLGLAAFKEEDAINFFGREFVAQQLFSVVNQKSFVTVVGASGSGKSSVVFAGLIPLLKQDNKRDWLIVDFRPGNNPFESLAISLLQGLSVISTDVETQYIPSIKINDEEASLNQSRLTELELEVELRSGKNSLENFVEPFILGNQNHHLAIIVDQFEEIFTLCSDVESRHRFIDNLLNLIKNLPGCTVIITLRADFYAEALSYRPLADVLQDGQVNLAAMNEEELQAAIEKPAVNSHVSLESGLSQRLIDAVLESPSNLPLLEFTLTQLWEKQRDGWLTHQAYEEIGGVETALANHGEAIYGQLSSSDKQRVQEIFIQLVQFSERSTDIRRLAIREEVGEDNWDLVTWLADGRLVVTNLNQVTGVETVEIVHEALIKNWRRLQKWIREDGEFRYWQEQLRVFIRQWENSDKDDDVLLRGKSLIDAEAWLLQRSNQITNLEARFINLSLDLRDREVRDKKAARRRIIIGLVGGLIGALSLAGFAGLQWRRAEDKRRESEINQIKSLSLSAKTLLNSGNQVEALSSTLIANKKLINLKKYLDAETRMELLSSLLENFNSIREYNRFKGHDATVNSVSFSSDGKLLASGSEDNTIKIWRRDGKFLQSLEGHQDGVFSVFFSPDNQYLIAASFDNTLSLRKYNPITGLFTKRPVITISEPEGLWSVALNSKDNIIATGNENGKVKFWSLDGKLIKTITAHNQKIWSLNFSPDGKYFATASADNTIKIWDGEGRFLKTLTGHQDEVLSVNFSPDNKKIVSGSRDKTVKLWNFTGKLLYTFKGHIDEVLDVRFSRDGKSIASASADDTVRVWDIALKKEIYHHRGHGSKPIEVKFSPDGNTLAIASADNSIKLKYFKSILPTFAGNSLSFSPDGKTVAISNYKNIGTPNSKTIAISNHKNIGTPNSKTIAISNHKNIGTPNSKTVAISNYKNIAIANFKTVAKANYKKITLRRSDGSLIHEFGSQNAEIVKIKFSPTGKYLVTIDRENQIKVWNLQGKLLQQWSGHDVNNNDIPIEIIRDISISPDGKKIATIGGFDKQVKLWDIEGKLINSWKLNDNWITSIKFSPDGEKLATVGDKTVKLWNFQGKLLQTFIGHKENVTGLSFNSDGTIIATGSNDKTVKLWQSQTGELLQSLNHPDNVYTVDLSHDDKFIMSGSKDKTLSIWNLNGKLVNRITGHQGEIKQVEFNSNKTMFASIDMKNNVILWNLDMNRLQQQGCDWLKDYLNTTTDLNESQRRVCN